MLAKDWSSSRFPPPKADVIGAKEVRSWQGLGPVAREDLHSQQARDHPQFNDDELLHLELRAAALHETQRYPLLLADRSVPRFARQLVVSLCAFLTTTNIC